MKDFTQQLILIDHCNLQCKYCYIRPDGHSIMPLDVAKTSIRRMVDTHPPQEWYLTVAFMGGEPLLAFSRMREICEWMWAEYPQADIMAHFPTNGTLLTDEVKEWLFENRHRISPGLSYDGDAVQNQNRSNSKDEIEPDFFRKTWPNHTLKMTIAEEGVHTLADNICDLHLKGYRVAANPACGAKPWAEESVREYGRQMMKLADFYLEHPQVPKVDLIDIELRLMLLRDEPMRCQCSIGNNYETVDIDGSVYPCHMLSSLALDEQARSEAAAYDFMNRTDYNIEQCVNCLYHPVCPRCYGMSFQKTGSPFTIDENLCILIKEQVKAACSYHLRRMSRQETLSHEDRQILTAIREINRETQWL